MAFLAWHLKCFSAHNYNVHHKLLH
uniref:Uncharacterized protein n=1 Tax=Rhizophora mucronata TaxID=61149 RepID=A0A2P2P302_RHIMU